MPTPIRVSRATLSSVAMLALLACTPEAPPPSPPASLSWADEARLVEEGLAEVKALHRSGQADAAKALAERVYTDRWEPDLEPAARLSMEGSEVIAIEYGFGLLQVELGSSAPAPVEARVRALGGAVRTAADAAARTFPTPGQAPPPPADAPEARPVVPDVPPNWEADETGPSAGEISPAVGP
jgi:hypothetical protein